MVEIKLGVQRQVQLDSPAPFFADPMGFTPVPSGACVAANADLLSPPAVLSSAESTFKYVDQSPLVRDIQWEPALSMRGIFYEEA